MNRRSYEALLEKQDPAWPHVRSWFADAKVSLEILPADRRSAQDALTDLQVTTRSPMGAIVHETGGVLVDYGWLRLLGCGSHRLQRGVASWTRSQLSLPSDSPPPYLLVADDVLGGAFAINGGGLDGELGKVFYFAPDTLDWEDLGFGYSDFLCWCISERLALFYADQRWQGWEAEVRRLSGDEALLLYPFPWAEGPSFGERSRRPVPLGELCALQRQVAST